ncbi:uncharacterized protein H6S33_005126 [Morchella sextelata]|uniref:uncharacterized protein n=1 Tax=Morchella sextelata TaxID=1174677 RepID=UPI001D05B9BB|nr:uncharacterized protein H6S33_005126 [Morchella sextelata]KAH0605144.1 hypothetical protein H6S33_005126 [Morchella sextelata]
MPGNTKRPPWERGSGSGSGSGRGSGSGSGSGSRAGGDKPKKRISKFTYRQLAQLAKYSVDTPLRVIAHIDLDAFYAQVETKRLSLPADEPLAVQQWQNLIAVNYAARAHSVTRHETATDALKRCPQLRLVHVATWRAGDMHWAYHDTPSIATHKACLDPYRAESKKILALFRSACPRVEKASIDESFLDLSAMVHGELVRRWPALARAAEAEAWERLPLPGGEVEVGWAGSCVLEKEKEEEGGGGGGGLG